MSFTIHFIDSAWNLKPYCLGTIHLGDEHSGENIAAAITELLNDWELNADHLVATTTDNGTNMVAAFNK